MINLSNSLVWPYYVIYSYLFAHRYICFIHFTISELSQLQMLVKQIWPQPGSNPQPHDYESTKLTFHPCKQLPPCHKLFQGSMLGAVRGLINICLHATFKDLILEEKTCRESNQECWVGSVNPTSMPCRLLSVMHFFIWVFFPASFWIFLFPLFLGTLLYLQLINFIIVNHDRKLEKRMHCFITHYQKKPKTRDN